MAELADALVSGISDRKVMQVQVLFSAPQTKKNRFAVLFCFGKMKLTLFSFSVYNLKFQSVGFFWKFRLLVKVRPTYCIAITRNSFIIKQDLNLPGQSHKIKTKN